MKRMLMEAVAVDKLIDKAGMSSEAALAIAEAMDIAIKAANLVTVSVLDARFAVADAKSEARFAAADAKAEARFAAAEARFAAADVKTEARFAAADAKTEARFAAADAKTEARFAATDAKTEARFAATDAKTEARFAALEKSIDSAKVWMASLCLTLSIALFSALAADHHWLVSREDQLILRMEQRFQKSDARQDAILDQIRALSVTGAAMRGTMTSQQNDSAASKITSRRAIPGKEPQGSPR
jgi:hypothetical protein